MNLLTSLRARWVDAVRGDARFAIRYFARHKATTAIIVAVIALGTGMNTFMFSALQSQFFRAAPRMQNDDALAQVISLRGVHRHGAQRMRAPVTHPRSPRPLATCTSRG